MSIRKVVNGHRKSLRIYKDEKPIVMLIQKEWETEFFQRTFGGLTIDHHTLLELEVQERENIFKQIINFADESALSLVEIKCDIEAMPLISIMENFGFRFVEGRVTFLTLIEKPVDTNISDKLGKIMFATKKDLKSLLDLTNTCFTYNPNFISRFKNRYYYTVEETRRYYTAYIENYLSKEGSYFGMLKKGETIVGYTILESGKFFEGKKIYKAILSAVKPGYRGKNLYYAIQSSVFFELPENIFYLENTTQMTNVSIIRSHIRANKRLNNIEVILYRKLRNT